MIINHKFALFAYFLGAFLGYLLGSAVEHEKHSTDCCIRLEK